MRKKKAKAAASDAGAPQETTPAKVAAPAPAPTERPPGPKDVGRQLRGLRRERGLSRADVARSAGLTKRELAAYESGRTEVPDHDLFCLAGSCGVEVDELLPGRDDLKVGPSGSSLTIAGQTQATHAAGSDEVLRVFADMIRELRELVPGAPAPWRAEDMAALAHALGGSPAAIEARLVELTGATPDEAAQMRAVLVPAVTSSDPFSFGAVDPVDPAHDFFAAPRAADPFAPPPPIAATTEPERVPSMAGAPLHAAMVGTEASPVASAAVGAEPFAAPGLGEPFGVAPESTYASHVVSAPLTPISEPLTVFPLVDESIPPYWGIGGEEIFLWGDSSANAVNAAAIAVARPTPVAHPIVETTPVAEAAPVWTPEPEAAAPAPVAEAAPVWSPEPEPVAAAPAPGPAPAPASAPAATADVAWQVGGTIEGPAGDPAAATRWALSDLRVPGDSTVEAVLDFAAGTGFGVLFRATADGHDRMSGYSFDVDPLGGAYVVRQWVENLPHWQTLAQTPASPTRQYGRHSMTISLVGDSMTASVDGVHVMTIASLGEASIATGCEPARGHRVGLQATPTADVTVESFRATPA